MPYGMPPALPYYSRHTTFVLGWCRVNTHNTPSPAESGEGSPAL